MPVKLSPKEEKRLNRLLKNAGRVAGRKITSMTDNFVLRQYVKSILSILGISNPNKIVQAGALDIVKSPWPFKKFRLRKLVEYTIQKND